MEKKKLFFEKEVIARLQDEEMSHIMGASSHSNTSTNKEDPIETPGQEAEESKSCCQKSCNEGK
ncbi:MAG: class I lanthipeptide [Phocaeicola sp.]|nr:class I lanthipeptide [Phocaeicola sp.]MDD7447915.1 class I lanthipeptide [Prevotellaceae bacterium]MDY5939161.1 class I lanthipeptide [Phocaeicola sp.]